jgi:transposase InsO family protein
MDHDQSIYTRRRQARVDAGHARHLVELAPPPHRPALDPARLSSQHADQFDAAHALFRDRASQFIDAFDEILRAEGFKILKTPVRTPVANSYAERWIGSIRRELLDRTIIWNQRQLDRVVTDYIAHYNHHRPHRSLQQRPPDAIDKPPPAPPATITTFRSTRCDGLINEYQNA